MQALKNKLNDWREMSKAKAEAKAEEKEEIDIAKERMEVADEVRLAKEADAKMEIHLAKAEAGKKVEEDIITKHISTTSTANDVLHNSEPDVVETTNMASTVSTKPNVVVETNMAPTPTKAAKSDNLVVETSIMGPTSTTKLPTLLHEAVDDVDPRIATAHPSYNNIWSSPGNRHI